jgi:hypothetical protein
MKNIYENTHPYCFTFWDGWIVNDFYVDIFMRYKSFTFLFHLKNKSICWDMQKSSIQKMKKNIWKFFDFLLFFLGYDKILFNTDCKLI